MFTIPTTPLEANSFRRRIVYRIEELRVYRKNPVRTVEPPYSSW